MTTKELFEWTKKPLSEGLLAQHILHPFCKQVVENHKMISSLKSPKRDLTYEKWLYEDTIGVLRGRIENPHLRNMHSFVLFLGTVLAYQKAYHDYITCNLPWMTPPKHFSDQPQETFDMDDIMLFPSGDSETDYNPHDMEPLYHREY